MVKRKADVLKKHELSSQFSSQLFPPLSVLVLQANLLGVVEGVTRWLEICRFIVGSPDALNLIAVTLGILL